ncbi:unnamed protein product [Blepharisma stoltei]|uniref:START domain-containing protein n=1 Tax=Blepharisma stoltei TaxID=1481888 RepID=A0AAU9JDG0_9CILI|nr:unnamed protein product [Blepharisma stoltei]
MGNRETGCFSCFEKQQRLQGQSSDMASPIAFAPMENDISDSRLTSDTIEKEEPKDDGPFSRDSAIRLIDDCQEKFLSIIKTNFEEEKYILEHNQEGLEIFSCDTNEGFMIISRWKAPFTPERIVNFLRCIDNRKQWDKNIADIKQICAITPDISVYYQLYKKVLAAAPRDLLLISKITQVENTMIEISTSIDSPVFPEKKDIVRAQLFLGGYYIKPIEKDTDGNICEVTNVSQASFGGSIPKGMLKKMSIKLVPTYIKSLVEGIKSQDSKENNNDAKN